MAQLTWRPSDELLSRVRAAAAESGRSVNDYVNSVLDAATNPALAGSDVERLRQRLQQAGLLAPPGRPRTRPPADAVESARAHAGRGKPLSEIVAESR